MFGKLFGKGKDQAKGSGKSEAEKAKETEDAAMGATAATSGATGVIANSG
jgi:hypothetical protein